MVNNYGTGKLVIKGYDVYYKIIKTNGNCHSYYHANRTSFSSLIKMQCYLETLYNETHNFGFEQPKVYKVSGR